MPRIPVTITKSGVGATVLASFAIAMAFAIAVAFANVLLLPLRVYLTGTATAGVIDQCVFKEVDGEPGQVYFGYLVKTRGSDDFILISSCDPKTSGNSVTIIYSKVAGERVAVMGSPSLTKIYLGLDGPAGSSFIFAIMLSCGLTLYRANTILQFGRTEFRKAWAPVTLAEVDRWKAVSKASEVLTDFLFLGLILLVSGIVVYTLFRTTLYAYGKIWFSMLAVGSLALIWSSVPLEVIRFAWRSYKSPLFVIIRNVIAGLLMLGSIRTIYKMPQAAEFTSLHGFFSFVMAVLKVSIGLDAK